MKYIQWKVKADRYSNTFDNEPAARRDYGKKKTELKKKSNAWIEFWARETHESPFVLVQSCVIR